MLRRIFGRGRDEVKGEWRRLRKEELYHVYYSPNIFRLIKSRKLRWAGMQHVWWRGDVRRGFCWGNLREGDHFENSDVDGRIRLKWILEKWDGAWTGSIWIRGGTGGGLL